MIVTNARTVFGWSLAALLLIAGGWAWRESSPPDYKLRISKGAAGGDKRAIRLGVLDYVAREAARTSEDVPTLFRGPYGYGYLAQKPIDIKPVEVKPGEVKPGEVKPGEAKPGEGNPGEVKPPAGIKPPVAVKPPPVRETVALTYRGLLRRPDGKEVALVQNTKTRRSGFYAVGETVSGIKVVTIRTDDLEVQGTDGATIKLILGEPKVFEEGKLAK